MNETYVCPGCGGVAKIRAQRCEYCGNTFIPILKFGPAQSADEAGLRKKAAEVEARLVRMPNDGRAHYEAGQAYHHLGDYAKAQSHLKAAAALNPDKPDCLYLLAWNTGIMQGWECLDIEKCAQAALSLNPAFKQAEALLHLGRGAQAFLFDRPNEKHQRALDEFRAAIELDAMNAYSFYYIGCIYEREGDLAQAADYFRKAAALSTRDSAPNAEHARLFARVGCLYINLGRRDDARKFLSDAVALDPGNSAAQDMLARLGA